MFLSSFFRRLDTKKLDFQKSFYTLSGVYFLAILSIIRANINYNDDMGRVVSGAAGYESAFGRWGSTILSYIVHTDTYLMDVSPLPQIIAVLVMALTSILILRVITREKTFSVFQLMAAVPIGISPYFLQCISFKYDSPYMAISVFFSVLPFFFAARKMWIYCAITATSIFCMCTTYQASSGVFPVLVVLVGVIALNRKEDIKAISRFIVFSVLGYLLGILLFKLLLVSPAANGQGYVSTQLASPLQIVRNYRTYFSFFLSDFKRLWIILTIILVLSYFYYVLTLSRQPRWLAFLLAVFSLLAMGALCLGVYPMMSSPMTAPRAMYGIGILIGCLAIYVASCRKAWIGKISACVLTWCFFVFAFTYGNALSYQREFADYRIQITIDDLHDLGYLSTEEIKEVQVKGNIGYAPSIRYMPRNFVMLTRLIPVTYEGPQYFGSFAIQYFYDLKTFNFYPAGDFSEMNLPLLADNDFEAIYGDEHHIIVQLK